MRRRITTALLSAALLLPLAPAGAVAAQRPVTDCPPGFVGPVSPVDRPGPPACVKETPHGPLVIPVPPPPSKIVAP